MKKLIWIIGVFFLTCNLSAAQIEKWDFFELSLPAPANGNPFIGIDFTAEFKKGDKKFEVEGFYDGGGIFKIRFMPDKEGTWTFKTKSNNAELDAKQGQFECIVPL